MSKRSRSESETETEDHETQETTAAPSTLTFPSPPLTPGQDGYMVLFVRGEASGEWRPRKIWYVSSEGPQLVHGNWTKRRRWSQPTSVAWWISLLSSSLDEEGESDTSVPFDLDMTLLTSEESVTLLTGETSKESSSKKSSV